MNIINQDNILNTTSVVKESVIRVFVGQNITSCNFIKEHADSLKLPTGINQFQDNVISLLTSKYKFEIIEDDYLQNKSIKNESVSDTTDSPFIYIKGYFNLANSEDALKRFDIVKIPTMPDVKILCHIYLMLYDLVYSTTLIRGDKLQKCYQDALDDLCLQLDARISYLVKWANKKHL